MASFTESRDQSGASEGKAMGADSMARAVSAVAKAMSHRRLSFPKSTPTLRIEFDTAPSLLSVPLVLGFERDAFFVFGQFVRVTDANYACLRVDFEPSESDSRSLVQIRHLIETPSEFDDLVVKYRIISVEFLNFPNTKNEDEATKLFFD